MKNLELNAKLRSLVFNCQKEERERERVRAHKMGGAEGGESQANSPLSTEPNARLDLTTLRSGPEQKPESKGHFSSEILKNSEFSTELIPEFRKFME